MTNVKDVIMKLRAVRVEKDLSYDKILSMLEDDSYIQSSPSPEVA